MILATISALTLVSSGPDAGPTTLFVVPAMDARASALSADGSTVVGVSAKRAFAWRIGSPQKESGKGSIDILSEPGEALAVSDDGSLVVGNGVSPARGEVNGRRWIGSIPSAPPPVGPRIGGIAAGVSGDGALVVGSAILNYESGRTGGGSNTVGIGEAATLRFALLPSETEPSKPENTTASSEDESDGRASVAGGLDPQAVPRVDGFNLGWSSLATAISRDGSTIVGTLPKPGSGFYWTKRSGSQPIGDLPGGRIETRPYAVDGAGETIVGSARSANGIEAFVCTADGMRGLGDFPGGAFRSVARAVSSDGRVVVGVGSGAGFGKGEESDRAFIWDAKNGMRDLAMVIGAGGISKLPDGYDGWTLREATAVQITPDGHPQIAGSAIDADGHWVAFVATLGETVAL